MTGGGQDAGWIELFRRQGHHVRDVSLHEKARVVRLGAGRQCTVNLTGVRAGESVELHPHPGTTRLQLVGPEHGFGPIIVIAVPPALRRIEVANAPAVPRLKLRGQPAGQSLRLVFPGSSGVTTLSLVDISVDTDAALMADVALDNASLRGEFTAGALFARGDCGIEAREVRRLMIENACVRVGSSLTVGVLVQWGQEFSFASGVDREVTVTVEHVMVGDRVVIDRICLRRISDEPWFRTIEGRGHVKVHATLAGLALQPRDGKLRLSVGRHVVATGVTGEFVLSGMAGARLEGAPGLPPLLGGVDLAAGESLRGGQMLGVDVRAAAMDDILALEELARFVPSLSTFDDYPPAWRGLMRFVRGQRHTPDKPDHAARLYEEIARLTERASGRGAATTKAWHAAQRARIQAVDSPWERMLLRAYRLVGFGERPGPALATLAAALLVMTVAVAVDQGRDFLPAEPAAYLRFLALAGEVVIAMPLFVLRLGSEGDIDLEGVQAWLKVLGRVITTIPLAFFVLGLRRFARFR